MGTKDQRIDAYISKAAAFAQPVLEHLRALVHEACPQAEETIKWSFPHFMYKGSILCSMASFKQHCAFGFWKAALMKDTRSILNPVGKTAMGHLGQIKSMVDLPPDKVLKSYIKQAMKLNEEGITIPSRNKSAAPKELEVPAYFMQALKKNKKAQQTFEAFNYSNKKDYVEWVTEAKTEATREKRMTAAVEWMAEGRIRNWKYAR